jgi:glycosyltransferase involved in cell wall biosynthesis
MIQRHKATFISIVPSPYQRDLFAALAARDDIDLSVYYMEAASPDSPWPEAPLRSFEKIMGGFWAPFRGARVHINWPLPDLSGADFTVLGSFSSLTAQWLMRSRLRGTRWLFWGERLRSQPGGWRHAAQASLLTPLTRATALVGIGREAELDYARRFPLPRHFCIPYYCDISQFRDAPREEGTGRPITFFFCGQMIRRKGVDLLLTAFDRLVAAGIDARLLLVGREAELPLFLSTLRPAARALVRYEGFQPPERLPEFFARSDVFILPSRYDGWGVVVNQALGAGLPVITSDAVGAGMDLVEEGVNGSRFAAGDAGGLYSAMERLALDPALAREWGAASRRKSLTLTPEAGAAKWAAVFDSLSAVR